MSQDNKMERNKRNFANLVLNHMDKDTNSDLDAKNVNVEFAAENEAQFMHYNNSNKND